ncbi:helix-turn-helix domain-containing protein [Bacillus sp. JCM 19041]|uniref:PucR family transcriptional regulator n=1 Tax=Bacillus sp. JCM 19041 TaxID=1460637 RepID=UPI0006D22608
MKSTIQSTFNHALWKQSDLVEERWTLQYGQDLFHFNRTKLSDGEQLLLSVLFTEVTSVPKPHTSMEKAWHRFLYTNGPHPDETTAYTAVQFHLEHALDDVSSFREAVLGSFPVDTNLIWNTATNGLLLFKSDGDFLDLHAIVELIEADFYTGVQLFLGVPAKGSRLYDAVLLEAELFSHKLENRAGQTVFTASEAGLTKILESIPDGLFNRLQQHFFPPEVIEDDELLKTIRIYLQNNLNNSQTAKCLHLHRNSLQYRLDKFKALTGIEIRLFYQAVFTSLLLPHK